MDNHTFDTVKYNMKRGRETQFGKIVYCSIIVEQGSDDEYYCIKGDRLYNLLKDELSEIRVYEWNHFVNDGTNYRSITRLILNNNNIVCLKNAYKGFEGCGPSLAHGVVDTKVVLSILKVSDMKLLSLPMNLHEPNSRENKENPNEIHAVYYELQGTDQKDIKKIAGFDIESGIDNKVYELRITPTQTIKVIKDLSLYKEGNMVFNRTNGVLSSSFKCL